MNKFWIPLIGIPFVFIAGIKIKSMLPEYVLTPEVAIYRYVFILGIGFLIGVSLFLFLIENKDVCYKHFKNIEIFFKNNEKKFLSSMVLSILSLYSIVLLCKYYSHHYKFFDFGIYDHKIWMISIAPFWKERFKIICSGHFQPILFIYAFLYKILDTPLWLIFLQLIAVISGIIPLYLIGKEKLKDEPFLRIGVIILYLLYPPVAFNIFCDFHPDHLYIPIFLWVLYFIEKENYKLMFLLLGITCCIKEPFILGGAVVGIYLILKKKEYLKGGLLFIFFFLFFLIITFKILPFLSGTSKSVLESHDFSYLKNRSFLEIFKSICSFSKLKFIFYVMYPFLFLLIFTWQEFILSLPFLLIPLLSFNPQHQNVASHYTAGLIPAFFFTLVVLLAKLLKDLDRYIVNSLMVWMLFLTLVLNISHSPLPLSVAFWNKKWSFGEWHYTNYIKTKHAKLLEEAVFLIPEDPQIKVVTHSEFYFKSLARHYFYYPFPQKWKKADYIILDNKATPVLVDKIVKSDQYFSVFKTIVNSGIFKIIFDKDGIFLLQAKKLK